MCNPLLIVTAVSAVISLAGSAQAASAQKEAGKANQAIAENNAKVADAAKQDALNVGAQEQQKAAWRTRQQMATQRASAASAGVDLSLGSAADIQDDTAMFGGIEQATIAQNAARKAWGYEVEASNFRNNGAQGKFQADSGAKSTMLSGLGNAVGAFRGSYLGAAPGKG